MRRMVLVAAAVSAVLVISAAPGVAEHDHFIVTPNGRCHQVAAAQTSIGDPAHGGHHQFHAQVHTGAAAPDNKTLGHGHGAVEVYKAAGAPDICLR